MMYKSIWIFLISVVLVVQGTSIYSQPQPYSRIEDTDVIEEQQDVLRQKYPHYFEKLVIDSVILLDSKHSKICYAKDDVYHEAVVNRQRKDLMLVTVASELPLDGVPEVITRAFNDSKYKNNKIEKAFYVTTPYQEDYYALDIDVNGLTDRVYFDHLGVLQPDPY